MNEKKDLERMKNKFFEEIFNVINESHETAINNSIFSITNMNIIDCKFSKEGVTKNII